MTNTHTHASTNIYVIAAAELELSQETLRGSRHKEIDINMLESFMLTGTIQSKMIIVSSFTQHVFPMCEHKRSVDKCSRNKRRQCRKDSPLLLYVFIAYKYCIGVNICQKSLCHLLNKERHTIIWRVNDD